jgi:16S rRNA (cytidine1402-2'-O)-methyltransferase
MEKRDQCLYIIPSTLGGPNFKDVLPDLVFKTLNSLDHFVVEEVRSARRFLIRSGLQKKINDIHFYVLNEHTSIDEIPAILNEAGTADLGLLSEAGMPAIADPGSELVAAAMIRHLKIVPLSGPSSILLALMASGLNGQNFAFNGYLPAKGNDRTKQIRFFESRSREERQTQIFIEAPYRNNQLIRAFVETCKPSTHLCIAASLTLGNEWIKTHTIQHWQQYPPPDLNRKPAVFLLLA